MDENDLKLILMEPVVVVDFVNIEAEQIKENQCLFTKTQFDDFLHRANAFHQAKFRFIPRKRLSVQMGRQSRATATSEAVSKTKKSEPVTRRRTLRPSNIINVDSSKTPSPITSPSRGSSLAQSEKVATEKAISTRNSTRRLLPTVSKTCPRVLRQKAGISSYKEEEEIKSSSTTDSDDSTTMCSPTKKSAVTPSTTKTRGKSAKTATENVEPKLTHRASIARTPRVFTIEAVLPQTGPQSTARRRGRPSLKPAVAKDLPAAEQTTDLRPKSKQSTPSGPRRQGRPLLKTGRVSKAVKRDEQSSPSSWSSEYGDDTDVENAAESILVRAVSQLHVSNEDVARQSYSTNGQNWAPLGREKEGSEIFTFIADHLKAGTSGSLFVAGVPGIGKSATINAVLERINRLSHATSKSSLPKLRLVTVNGFHFGTPVRFYCEVHRQLVRFSSAHSKPKGTLRGKNTQQKLKRALGPKAALEALNAYFTGRTSIGSALPTVLVVDELDALVSATTANQVAFGGNQVAAARRTANFGANRVLYNLLEWASTPTSRLVIVAVANTLDLPERALPLRVVSRLGLHRLAFMPYTHIQLQSIVQSRLASLPKPVFDSPDAILLAARKVAMASGDARRVLELCRLAVERALRQSRSTVTMQDVVAASESLSSATSRLGLVKHVAISWRRVLTALVNVCRMQCRDHGACLVRELHSELMDMWREEGNFSRPTDVEVIRIVGNLVASGILAAEDVPRLGIQAHVQLTMPLPDLANVLASLLGK